MQHGATVFALILSLVFALCVDAYTPAPYAPYPPEVQRARAEAAILGSLAADAATMGLHWIYDTNQIKRLVGSGVPEFFHPPSCPFYKLPDGEQTLYGQQAWAYLQAGSAGSFNPTSIESFYWDIYKDGGIAQTNHWYFDGSTKGFVANKKAGKSWPQCGANDDQANAIAHQVFVTALYAGNTTAVLNAADTAIRVTQNTDKGVAFGLAAARILEKIITTDISGYDAVYTTIQELRSPTRLHPNAADAELATGLQRVLGLINQTNFNVVQQIGQACEYPFNLLTGSHLIAQLDNSVDAFISGVRQTIFAGGDNGSRNSYVGAIQGARLGNKANIPAAWKTKMNWWARYEPLAAKIVSFRK